MQPMLVPAPVLHTAGRKDPLVKFALQERTIAGLRKLDQCADVTGQPWAGDCTLYMKAGHPPVVTLIHDGEHANPAYQPERVVKFFKEYETLSPSPAH